MSSNIRKSKRDLLRQMLEPMPLEQDKRNLPQPSVHEPIRNEEEVKNSSRLEGETSSVDVQTDAMPTLPGSNDNAGLQAGSQTISEMPEESSSVTTATVTPAAPQQTTAATTTIPFAIQPKEKKQPKAVTHQKITPEIYIPLLNEFDNIASHLDYSRAELLEEVMRNFVQLVKQTHPEWAEKPAPRKQRGRRR